MPLSCWGASLARKWSRCFHGIVVVHGVCGRVARARISCFRASSGVSRHRYWPNMAYMSHPAGSKDCACFLHSWMEQTRSLTPVLSFLLKSASETCFFWMPLWMRTYELHMRIKTVDSSNHTRDTAACLQDIHRSYAFAYPASRIRCHFLSTNWLLDQILSLAVGNSWAAQNIPSWERGTWMCIPVGLVWYPW